MKRLPDPIGAYAILDAGTLPAVELIEAAGELALGGIGIFQVRAKNLGVGAFVELVRAVRMNLPPTACLIVNDRVDVALATDADGVHLGDEDLPVSVARRLLPPGAVIGWSTHSLAEVRAAQILGCDYLGFGPLFASGTKVTNRPEHGLPGLARACAVSALPIVGIGGIGIEALAGVRASGASGAAMIAALLVPGRFRKQGLAAVKALAGKD